MKARIVGRHIVRRRRAHIRERQMATRAKKQQTDVLKLFSRRLRDERRTRGLSQMKLAVKSNIHISYLGRLERGESAPSIDTVAQIAGALGVDVAALLRSESGDMVTIP